MMTIRPELPYEQIVIARVIEQAFRRTDEARLVERLRSEGDAVISLVAAAETELVGHVMLSRMEAPFRALALAPAAVIPIRQGTGIGTALIMEALKQATDAGWEGVFVLGHPAFYERFGFRLDLARSFSSPYAGPHFMGLALGRPLPATQGRLVHAPAFAGLD